jgi:hypothetical protein
LDNQDYKMGDYEFSDTINTHNDVDDSLKTNISDIKDLGLFQNIEQLPLKNNK